MKLLMVKCWPRRPPKAPILVECMQISGSSTASNAEMKELSRECGSATKNIITVLELQGFHQLLSTVELDPEVSNLLRLSSALNRASWGTGDSELVPNANRVVAIRIGVQVVERMASRVMRCHRRGRNCVRIGRALCSRTI